MFRTIRKQLRDGVELRSPFDPLSLPAYAVIASAALIGAILMTITGFGFDLRLARIIAICSVSLFVAAWLLRSVGHGRAAGALEVTTLVVSQGFVFLFVLLPLTALSGPFADDLLSRADAGVGFHWGAFARELVRHPAFLPAWRYVYDSFDWQVLIVAPALAICRLEKRMWTFAVSCSLALAVTAAIFPFFPAEGAFRHSGLAAATLPGLASQGGWHFGAVIHLIKDQGARYIDRNLVTGIVSFPSYHASAAVLFTWAVWPIRLLRWPLLILNAAMAVAAIPFGAHYLVDIIAGIGIGFVGIWLGTAAASWADRRRGGGLAPAQFASV